MDAVTERLFLTAEELIELTGRKRGQAQAGVLRKLGIPFYLRDRRVIVTRVAVEGHERGKQRRDPFNWSALT
jgi:hypothetical protein